VQAKGLASRRYEDNVADVRLANLERLCGARARAVWGESEQVNGIV
jgi:hypothetical protein